MAKKQNKVLLIILAILLPPIAVILIINPLFEIVVSPPTRSILNFLHAASMQMRFYRS
mgnify:CR=1 FL=1